MSVEPKRLVDDPSDPLAGMIRAAEEDVLSAEGIGRLRATLAAGGIAASAVPTAATVAKPAAAAGTSKLAGLSLVKLGLAALSLFAIAAGVVVARGVTAEPPSMIAPPSPPLSVSAVRLDEAPPPTVPVSAAPLPATTPPDEPPASSPRSPASLARPRPARASVRTDRSGCAAARTTDGA